MTDKRVMLIGKEKTSSLRFKIGLVEAVNVEGCFTFYEACKVKSKIY